MAEAKEMEDGDIVEVESTNKTPNIEDVSIIDSATINVDLSVVPKLDNATPSFLADELGAAKQIEKDAKKYAGIMRTALLVRIDTEKGEGNAENPIRGERYQATVSEGSRSNFSKPDFTSWIENRMDIVIDGQIYTGEELLTKFTSNSAVTTVKTTKVE